MRQALPKLAATVALINTRGDRFPIGQLGLSFYCSTVTHLGTIDLDHVLIYSWLFKKFS